MNYTRSQQTILPDVNDTPALYNALQARLQQNTTNEVPFCLMPVRTETRFMKVEKNLLEAQFSENVQLALARLSSAQDLATSFSLYQGFTNDILVAASNDVQDAIQAVAAPLTEVESLNYIERHELNYKVSTVSSAVAQAATRLLGSNTNQEQTQGLLTAITQNTSLLQSFGTLINNKPTNQSWDEVSPAAVQLVNNIQAVNQSVQSVADYVSTAIPMNAGELNSFISLASNATNYLRTASAEINADIDRQYVWYHLDAFNNRISTVGNHFEHPVIRTQPNYKELYGAFFKFAMQLREAFTQVLQPGTPRYRIIQRKAESGYALDTLDVSSETLQIGLNIGSHVAGMETILNTLANDPVDFDTSLFQDYLSQLNAVNVQLSGSLDNTFEAYAYLSTVLDPLISQFASVFDLIGSIENPTLATDTAAAFDTATINLGATWSNARSVTLGGPWLSPTQIVDELWIRVYPDDIFVDTLERSLTASEAAAGQTYWTAWWAAHGDPDLELAAWQALVATFGVERAAWIAKSLTPTNLSNVVIASPVFNAVNHIQQLSTYTAQLATLSQSSSRTNLLALSYWDFYTPQLNHLGSVIDSIPGLPQLYATKLQDSIIELRSEFQVLGDYAITIQPEYAEDGTIITNEALENAVETVNNHLTVLDDLVQNVNVLSSWEELYTQIPQFPSVQIKTGEFTEPAQTTVLPDRFLFAALDNHKTTVRDPMTDSDYGSYLFRHIKIGNRIPNTIYLGIDPQTATFTDTAIGNFSVNYLKADPKILWMFDFAEAESKGMAIRIRLLNSEPQNGFDKLLVLGLRLEEGNESASVSTLPYSGKSGLENLLESHRFSKGGLSLLPLGTPTNNTENADAAFNLPDPNSRFSFQTNVSKPLFTPTSAILDKRDGQWLADALGINYSVLQHVAFADKSQISNAIAINRALAPGTVISYMKEMMNYLFTDRNVSDITNYFTDYVLGRGTLPSIRIADQPYGIMPITSYGRWTTVKRNINPGVQENYIYQNNVYKTTYLGDFQQDADYSGTSFNNNDLENLLRDRFDERLKSVFEILNKTWQTMNDWFVKTVEKNSGSATTQKDFIEILGTDASMAEAYSRIMLNDAAFYKDYKLYGHGYTPADVWTSKPDLPSAFFTLFNQFNFLKPGAATNSGYGLFDITEFINSDIYPMLPDMSSIKNALQINSLRHLADKFDLYGPTVDEKLVLSEIEKLPQISGKNYIEWLQTASISSIWNNNDFKHLRSRSLLFLLLRQSTLLTYRETAWDILERANLITKSARKIVGTPEGIMLQQSQDINSAIFTKWHLLFNSIDTYSPNGTPAGAFATFYNYVASNDSSFWKKALAKPNLSAISWTSINLSLYLKGNGPSDPTLVNLTDWTAINRLNGALDRLKNCSNAELDRLLREHVDLCTYRLDAWNAGMVNKRLRELRNTDDENTSGPRKMGIYLGAYSWLFDVRPKNPQGLKRVKTSDVPSYLTNNEEVYFDPSNLGFIHTPSLSHAFTAALLRSGYVSERTSSDNRFAVNLTSERVSKALSLLEGIRNGQSLNALLGYEFERGLHESHGGVLDLDKLIYDLRRRFPLVDPATIQNNIGSGSSTAQPTQLRPSYVVDGIELLNRVRYFVGGVMGQNPQASIFTAYTANLNDGQGQPFSSKLSQLLADFHFTPPTTLSVNQTDAIIMEIDRIADAVDALGDLAVAEGVFQIASGNTARSAAVIEALSTGKNPPEPEIIRTPVPGYHVSHKLAVALKPLNSTETSLASPHYPYAPWSNVAGMTARALAEPSLNAWVADVINGAFPALTSLSSIYSGISCNVYSPVLSTALTIRLSDLQLQPIDLLYMVDGDDYSDEFLKRITYAARVAGSLVASNPVEVVLDQQGSSSIGSFAQMLSLLISISKLVGQSRWLNAEDFLPSGAGIQASAPAHPIYDNAELGNRYLQATNELTSLQALLASSTTISTNAGRLAAIDALNRCANLGVSNCVPNFAIEPETDVEAMKGIVAQVAGALTELDRRNVEIQPLISALSGANVESTNQILLDILDIVFGGTLKVIPHIYLEKYTNLTTDIQAQLTPSTGTDLLRHIVDMDETLDDWIHGLARVRDQFDDLEMLRLLMPGTSHALAAMRPVQFPYYGISTGAAINDYWVGVDYPMGYKPGDKHSVTLLGYQNLYTAMLSSYPYSCGLVLDDWTETIPVDETTTGITFNYDQPSAKPPQNILLAVHPRVVQTNDVDPNKPWQVEDLLHTLLDTIDMAKIRMVEPDHFRLAVQGNGNTPGDVNPYTKNTVTQNDINDTKRFEAFKWMLPAIVGEITPHRIDGNNQSIHQYQGADSVQQVSFDYNPNNDDPPVLPGTSTGSSSGGPISTGSFASLSSDDLLGSDNLQTFLNEQQALSEVAAIQDQLTATITN